MQNNKESLTHIGFRYKYFSGLPYYQNNVTLTTENRMVDLQIGNLDVTNDHVNFRKMVANTNLIY